MGNQRIIFLEFNELCPELLDGWMSRGLLPNFRKFYESSRVFTGVADVSDPEYLEPWIQWYSLHTGYSYYQHKVYHLTDGPKRGLKDIWQILLDSGYSVGNCAGMNAAGFQSPGSFYLPDPWCSTEQPYPAELQAYQRVVLTKVQENSNSSASLDKKAYLNFLQFVTTHGLSSASILAIMRQLMSEAFTKDTSWKRAALLDKLQLNIFLHYWRQLKPDFSSFFLNSTAHFQHSYFHLLQPEKFDLPAERFDDSAHRDAILFGYQEMDKLLAEFFELEKQGALLVLSTALSQQPNPKAGLEYYRPRNIQAIFESLRLQPASLQPVMAHQYAAEFPDQASADRARDLLQTVRYNGQPAFDFYRSEPRQLFFGSGIHGVIPKEHAIEFTVPDARTVPFYEVFYRVPHTKSGAHHPDSVLWFKTGDFQVNREKVSILNILPTLLDYYNVDVPRDGAMVREGRSILPSLGIGHYGKQPQAVPVAG